jgi:hypothetical protein
VERVRRIRVDCQVFICAASTNIGLSHTEAVARLDAAVRAAGGLLDIHRVTSDIVNGYPPLPTVGENGEWGDLG